MANSLRAKIKKLKHDGKIDAKEYDDLITKLDGHDKALKEDILNTFVTMIVSSYYLEEICSDSVTDEVLNEHKENLHQMAAKMLEDC